MSTTSQDSSAIARLHHSRRELERLLVNEDESHGRGFFPRSKVLQLLMNQRNATLLAIGAGGILLLRPRWLGRALRVMPIGALVRMFATRVLTKRMLGK